MNSTVSTHASHDIVDLIHPIMQTSSIAQFRVRDWGMEICQIVINIPPQPTGNATGKTTVSMSEPTAALDVWKLEADDYDFIDVRTVSWNSRPRRRTTLPMATLDLHKGTKVSTDKFSCPRDSIQTFEFSCRPGSNPCLVDFWQDGVSTSLGEPGFTSGYTYR